MFDFEKLIVYQKAKALNSQIFKWLKDHPKLDSITRDQLRRASLSIPLNIAEGSGRFSKADRRNFYTIARSSIFECVAVFDILKGEDIISEEEYEVFYKAFDEISRMLYAMIGKLS